MAKHRTYRIDDDTYHRAMKKLGVLGINDVRALLEEIARGGVRVERVSKPLPREEERGFDWGA